MRAMSVDPASAAAALKEMADALGADQVFAGEEDRAAYSDLFAADGDLHQPSGAVAPETVEQVQAVLRIANARRVPLWPVSRGKNFGYGTAAPVVRGSIVVDLSRMKKIELDAENGTVLVEPGVSFFDLFDYIQKRGLPLWLSVPGNSWGSVAGNALDRGVGYTPYGDHAAQICGIEAVLPDGDIVRTGMGAMPNSANWQLYRAGYGPSWDAMFCQSNFGIVTRLGLWLMPEPEAVLGINVDADRPEDLEWLVDTIAPLRRSGLIRQSPSIAPWLRAAATMTQRDQWAPPGQPLSQSAISAIRREFGIGWWSTAIRLYGPLEVTQAARKIVRQAFDNRPVLSISDTQWLRGDPPEGSPVTGVPITYPLANVNWFGGRGGHLSFSPVLPARGDLALKLFANNQKLHDRHGFDYHPSFSVGERSMNNINQLLFDLDDPVMAGNLDRLFRDLVRDAAAEGFAEYRAHIDYMDVVADTFSFNNHALRRLNERLKDALDPNGILAPGKSGIWPASAGRA